MSSRLQQAPHGQADRLLAPLGCPRVRAIYVHIPFCFHKCHYCDFYSIVGTQDRQRAFVERMVGEIHSLAPLVRGPVETIFIGGGTPTLLAAALWLPLLDALHDNFDIEADAEFTIEANPETVTTELLDVLAGGAVNRLSIGAQSFDPVHLKTLERWHEPTSVGQAMERARQVGITNLNLDLIYAIPGQKVEQWRNDLDQAIALSPTHLSCYALTYEPNTPLTVKMQRGDLRRADEDREAAMFELTIDHLAAAGFEQYEVSNFARRVPGQGSAWRCRHNMLYWQSANWLALGPSASGHIDGLRWKNVGHLGQYLASTGGAPVCDVEQLDPDPAIGEQLMLRLRLTDGVPLAWCEENLRDSRWRAVQHFIAQGLLERTATHLRLTRRGLIVADSVVMELL